MQKARQRGSHGRGRPPAVRSLGTGAIGFTDHDGHAWWAEVTFAEIGGVATPVGLSLQSFVEADTDGQIHPYGGTVTASTLRLMRLGEVIEAARAAAATSPGWTAVQPVPGEDPFDTVDRAEAAVTRYNAAREAMAQSVPRKATGRPPDWSDETIAEIAALYRAAVATGTRHPWQAVTAELTRRGYPPVTAGMITNFRRRAVRLGLLDPGTRPPRRE